MAEITRKRRSKFIPVTLPKKLAHSKKVLEVLQAIHPDSYGILTSEQIATLCFKKENKSYCDEVLKYMFHKPLRLVNRNALSFTKGLNNAEIAYTITRKGSRLLFQKGLGRLISPKKTFKMKNNTLVHNKHEKGLQDVRIALEKGAEFIGAQIVVWITDRKFNTPTIRSQVRVKDKKTGKAFGLQPDGFFVLKLASGELKPFFLEYDNNTTFHTRFRNVKIRGYHLLSEEWRKLPVFEPYKKIPVTYRVITVVNAGSDRTFNFKEKSAEAFFANDKNKTDNSKRFYFTKLESLTAESAFSEPIWYIPYRSKTKEQKFVLI